MKKDTDQENTLGFEIQFYEGIIKKKGNFIEALMTLGDLYTKKGDYAKGLEVDRKLALLRPEDPLVLYNLACSLSLAQRVDEAFETIKKAVECGYNDFTYLLHDKDLNNLFRDARFRSYLFSLAESKNTVPKKS